LKWADEHGIEPPTYAVIAAPAIAVTPHKQLVLEQATCLVEYGSSKCKDNTTACCTPVKSRCENCELLEVGIDSLNESAIESESTTTVVVLSIAAMKCQGQSSSFSFLPFAIVDEWVFSCTFPEPVVASYTMRNEWLPSSILSVDTPPPRA
jgi:hypothetical protein